MPKEITTNVQLQMYNKMYAFSFHILEISLCVLPYQQEE